MKIDQVYSEKITINPLKKPIDLVCNLPGSKSITNRALVIAALNSGNRKTHLSGILRSEDTEIMVDCLEKLGFILSVNWKECTAFVSSPKAPGIIPSSNANLFTGNSGTTMRFLTAMVGLGNGTYKLDGIKRMQERPINDLLKALNELNINSSSENNNGCPPVIIKTSGWSGGYARINSEMSSQFISGILMAAPFAKGETRMRIEPLVRCARIAIAARQRQQAQHQIGLRHAVAAAIVHLRRRRANGQQPFALEHETQAFFQFQPRAAQYVVDGDGLGAFVGDARVWVIAQILAHAGQMMLRGNAEFLQHVTVADAGQFQNFR